MLELIWGIINIALIIYFFIICFKVIKLIRENLGGIATLIFVFGLLSFIAKPNEENNKVKVFDIQNKEEKQIENKIVGNTYSKEITLEKNLVTKIFASITFEENNNEIKLLNSYTDRSGFVSGIDWKISTIEINKNKDNSYSYEIIGTKDWKIFGIQIYTQLKDFTGFFNLKK